jgi:hypothetical protein
LIGHAVLGRDCELLNNGQGSCVEWVPHLACFP